MKILKNLKSELITTHQIKIPDWLTIDSLIKPMIKNYIKFGNIFIDINKSNDNKRNLSCCWCGNIFLGESDELYCTKECDKLAEKENA